MLAFFAAGALLSRSQSRYLSRYREIHGVDPFQTERIGPAPWLFFGLLARIMHDLFAAYSTVQADPNLERLRRKTELLKRLMLAAWALLMLLAIVRLASIA